MEPCFCSKGLRSPTPCCLPSAPTPLVSSSAILLPSPRRLSSPGKCVILQLDYPLIPVFVKWPLEEVEIKVPGRQPQEAPFSTGPQGPVWAVSLKHCFCSWEQPTSQTPVNLAACSLCQGLTSAYLPSLGFSAEELSMVLGCCCCSSH